MNRREGGRAPGSAGSRSRRLGSLRRNPSGEFTAQRDRDHEVATVGLPGGTLDELTDRQRGVLETAYRSGYFAWPRESTAEEVADSLNLASSTLHGHLREPRNSSSRRCSTEIAHHVLSGLPPASDTGDDAATRR